MNHFLRFSLVASAALVWASVCALGCTLKSDGLAVTDDGSAGQAGSSQGGHAGSSGHAGSAGQAGAAGSAGQAGAAGSAGASGQAGSGGSPPETESDCLDRIDNDSDGLTDCADPDCGPGYECVPSAPPGWEGYYRIKRQDRQSASDAPSCLDGSEPARFYEPNTESMRCECSCGELTGTECGPAALACSTSDAACTNANSNPAQGAAQHACTTYATNNYRGFSCKLGADGTVGNPGHCEATLLEEPALPQWDAVDDRCGKAISGGGGCGTDEQVCVPRAAETSALCIAQASDQAVCPSQWPAAFHTYRTVSEGRHCGDCSCDVDTSSVSCRGVTTYRFYDVTCWVGESKVVNSTQCVDLSSFTSLPIDSVGIVLEQVPRTEGTGTCTQSAPQPLGKVDGTDPTTFCCQP